MVAASLNKQVSDSGIQPSHKLPLETLDICQTLCVICNPGRDKHEDQKIDIEKFPYL